MKRNLTEIMANMFRTMDCFGLTNNGYWMVEDVSPYTSNHYSGPGFIYSVELKDSDWSYSQYDVVLDENKEYLGTMAWIRGNNDGWFNDIDPDWESRRSI